MPVSFVNDIVPLFRPSDIDCMSGIDVALNDRGDMSDAAGDGTASDHAMVGGFGA